MRIWKFEEPEVRIEVKKLGKLMIWEFVPKAFGIEDWGVSGFEFRVSGFEFRVSGSEFRVSGDSTIQQFNDYSITQLFSYSTQRFNDWP